MLKIISEIRAHWDNRENIQDKAGDILHELPDKWSSSDTSQKWTVLAVLALCGGIIAMTLMV